MKEYTVTMNAQITFIVNEDNLVCEEYIRQLAEKDMAQSIKRSTEADDVVVSDLKLFIMDKENNDGK